MVHGDPLLFLWQVSPLLLLRVSNAVEFPVELSLKLPVWVSLVDYSLPLESQSLWVPSSCLLLSILRVSDILEIFILRGHGGWLCSLVSSLSLFFLWIQPFIQRSAPMGWLYGARCALHFFSTCWLYNASMHTLKFPHLNRGSALLKPDCSVGPGSNFLPSRTVLFRPHGVTREWPLSTLPNCSGAPN